MKKHIRTQTAALLAILWVGLSGCASNNGYETGNAPQGALLGSMLGAGIGALIGHHTGNVGAGAAIGAATGAVGGYVLGNEQDKSQIRSTTAQAMQSANTEIINVNNSNGSITPVMLHRQGNFYVGPKGEVYPSLPTEDQLRPVYGF